MRSPVARFCGSCVFSGNSDEGNTISVLRRAAAGLRTDRWFMNNAGYNQLEKAISSGNDVTLDFTGFIYLSNSFLNTSVGKLVLEHGWCEEEFDQHIRITGLDEADENRLRLTVANAVNRINLKRKNIDTKEFYTHLMPGY
jgi:hypothetical protein